MVICKDHENTEWNQPKLDDDECILCRLFYLEAQESLLEEWQQRAKQAEGAIEEMQRPLDAQMARLNAEIVRLNERIEEHNKGCREACGKTTHHSHVRESRKCDARRDCPDCPNDWRIDA